MDKRYRRLKKPGIAQKIMQVYSGRAHDAAIDPDAALYDAFLQEADRSRCEAFLAEVRGGGWNEMDVNDERLHTLAARLKSRSFAERLSEDEAQDWHQFVSRKLKPRRRPGFPCLATSTFCNRPGQKLLSNHLPAARWPFWTPFVSMVWHW